MTLKLPFSSFFMDFGKKPSKAQQARFAISPNHFRGRFHNMEETVRQKVPFKETWKIMTNRSAPCCLPSKKTDLKSLRLNRAGIVWFGHSTFLIQYKNHAILVDPVLGNDISPLRNYIKAFPGSVVYRAADLPDIDILLLTHDHFDHMDYRSLVAIEPKVRQAIVPLGLSASLEYWGYPKEKITELDWYDQKACADDILIISTPARHSSGRVLTGDITLWSSFVVQCGKNRIFISGDSGYGKHYRIIGEKYGPFDMALLENGQYSPYWKNLHSFPVEIHAIMKDLQAKSLFPIHWAKFTISSHDWQEPITLLFASKPDFPVTVPQIGELYTLGDPVKTDPWWEDRMDGFQLHPR